MQLHVNNADVASWLHRCLWSWFGCKTGGSRQEWIRLVVSLYGGAVSLTFVGCYP